MIFFCEIFFEKTLKSVRTDTPQDRHLFIKKWTKCIMLKSNFHKKLHLITFADPKMPFTVHEGLSKNYLMTVSVIFFPFALRNVSFLPPPQLCYVTNHILSCPSRDPRSNITLIQKFTQNHKQIRHIQTHVHGTRLQQ